MATTPNNLPFDPAQDDAVPAAPAPAPVPMASSTPPRPVAPPPPPRPPAPPAVPVVQVPASRPSAPSPQPAPSAPQRPPTMAPRPVAQPPVPPVVPPISAMPARPAPSIQTMPARPAVTTKGEPEDIFSALEQPKKAANLGAPSMETPASRGGAGKYVLIAIGVVAVLSLAGFAFWYFAIRSKAPVVPATVVEPVVQPTPAAVMEPEPTSSAATPSDTAAETVVTPITTPPEGTNIPLPDSITTETTTVVEPIPEEDTDQDGLSDRREVELGTDPNKADTDGDGLNDGDEVLKFGTNPLNPDTDGDSFSDGQEIQNSYNPRGPGSCSKTDCSL